jgi:hypothetical protein
MNSGKFATRWQRQATEVIRYLGDVLTSLSGVGWTRCAMGLSYLLWPSITTTGGLDDPVEKRDCQEGGSPCVVGGREEQGTGPPLRGSLRQRGHGHARGLDGPPSGEIGTYSSIRIHRIVRGKITDEWSEGSLLEMLLPAIEREIR